MARNVYIADHMHAFEDIQLPVLAQGITEVGAVEIGDGAWLGQNVVVGPGVRIGRGAVVGANSVVLADVPDHTVAVGAPAATVSLLCGELVEASRPLFLAYHFPRSTGQARTAAGKVRAVSP